AARRRRGRNLAAGSARGARRGAACGFRPDRGDFAGRCRCGGVGYRGPAAGARLRRRVPADAALPGVDPGDLSMANAAHRFRNGRGENALLDGFLALADEWVARAGSAAGSAWFREAIDGIVHATGDRALGVAIGLAPRRLGKADLGLTDDDRRRAAALRPDFDPSDWSIDQLARVAFMIASHDGDDATFAARFDGFCSTAEVNELIALCRGLPLY